MDDLSRQKIQTMMKEFQNKWCQKNSGFLKPTCHIDDIRDLVMDMNNVYTESIIKSIKQ